MSLASPPASRSGSFLSDPRRYRAFTALVFAAVALGLIRRVWFGLDASLWLDEVYTGAIAIGDSPAGLFQDALHEVSPPVYYLVIWAWEKIFGAGNLALRVPSVVFSLATPLLILWKGHPDRFTRLLWAAVVAIWIPAFPYAVEARSYALLFLLGVGQIILFLRLSTDSSLKSASLWVGLSGVFALTHYHSLLVTAFQGLAFLLFRGKAALRTWPAAFLFLPVIAWMTLHLPLVLRFASPTFAWQKLLGPYDALMLPGNLVGIWRPYLPWGAVAVVLVGLLVELWLRRRGRQGAPIFGGELLVVVASLASILMVVALGFLRPNFTFRYLISYMPGALLGVAVWTRVLAYRFPPLPWLVLGGFLAAAALDTSRRRGAPDWRENMSWEQASAFVGEQGARRLIFTWDNPTAALDPTLLPRVAGFFFDRAGKPIPVKVVSLSEAGDPDPNRVLIKAADRPGDAVIWLFDANVPRTRASTHPPALSKLDSRFRCRSYGFGVVACLRQLSASPSSGGAPQPEREASRAVGD